MKVRRAYTLASALAFAAALSAQGVVVKVNDSTAGWNAFMNVFELPSNGGGYVFGSPWAISDLRAVFDDSTNKLTLFPNSIGDANPFWYLPAGGPGSTGNKQMDAVLYRESLDGSMSDTTVTFTGTVLSNSFAGSHTARAFIRDFAPGFTSFNESSVVLAPGAFSISLDTQPGAGRIVQWGFSVTGPCVWITDIAPIGFAEVRTEAVVTTNLLTNGSFDRPAAFDGWVPFNNAFNEAQPFARSAPKTAKFFGPFLGVEAASGVYQQIPAQPGNRFRATVQWYNPSAEPIAGSNTTAMNVEWRDENGDLIGFETSPGLTALSPTNTWIARELTTGPAPEGTFSARYTLVFVQPNAEGGAAHADDAFIERLILPCPADLNGDNQVDNGDFVLFANAYNIFDCTDPAMPAGCPSDFNADQFVDNVDFVTFVTAYNEFLCP